MDLINNAQQEYWKPDWIKASADQLQREVAQAPNSEAINTILLVYPYIISNGGGINAWNGTLYELLMQGRAKVNNQSFLLMDDLSEIEEAFRNPPVPLETMLIAYIELLKYQIYNQSTDFNKIVKSVTYMASFVQTPSIQAKVNQTLSLAWLMTYRNQDEVIRYGKKSYDYYSRIGDNCNAGISAFSIASANRGINEHDQAIAWLDKASVCFTQTDYPAQYALIAAEYGMVYHTMNEHDKAFQWLSVAVRETSGEVNVDTIIGIWEAYAITLIKTEQYDLADEMLQRVYNHYDLAGNHVNKCRTCHTRAYGAWQNGEVARAMGLIKQGKNVYEWLYGEHPYLLENLVALEGAILGENVDE